ncbi:hypothetical protein SADUNF_Sadunf18G0114300 [Salix dunnii]|uniref:Uncharacterized protein n=1 Tax=Salix dunnii TaxID=1413687 RepID=A0A835J4B1_9ROSI|nr:hypothetical protein SADUNF_Sadunf18G0114300 [Salix dunnii]
MAEERFGYEAEEVMGSTAGEVVCTAGEEDMGANEIIGGYFLGFPLQLGFSGWKYHVLVGTEANVDVQEGFDGRYLLEVDKYMEVVDVYALTLLGTTLKHLDSAISWVEKAALPKNKQLVKIKILGLCHFFVLLKLISRELTNQYIGTISFYSIILYCHVFFQSLRTINLSQLSSVLQGNNPEAHYSSSKDINVIKGCLTICKEGYSRLVEACIFISSEPSSCSPTSPQYSTRRPIKLCVIKSSY